MEDTQRLEWDMSVDTALEINSVHKSGLKNWEELTLEYMEENNIPVTNTPDKHKEYFRRLVGRLVKQAAPKTLHQGLYDVMNTPYEDEITLDKIHSMTKMSKRDFKLAGRISTSVWGAMGEKEFETMFRNGSLKLNWEIRDILFDESKFFEFLEKIQPREVIKATTNLYGESHLVLTPFDAHFGIATREDYEEALKGYIELIRIKRRPIITIVAGQDYLHTNDENGHTENLTFIGKVDFNQMLEDGIWFMDHLVGEALAYADEVNVIYSRGNHDGSNANTLLRTIRALHPTANYDFTLDEYKMIRYGNVAIGLTHGEHVPQSRAGKQRLHDYYTSQFPNDFNMPMKRYIITGHYHNLKVTDEAGTLIYTLSTKVPKDGYHDKKAFVAAHKNFNAFEFTTEGLFAHYHIQ